MEDAAEVEVSEVIVRHAMQHAVSAYIAQRRGHECRILFESTFLCEARSACTATGSEQTSINQRSICFGPGPACLRGS